MCQPCALCNKGCVNRESGNCGFSFGYSWSRVFQACTACDIFITDCSLWLFLIWSFCHCGFMFANFLLLYPPSPFSSFTYSYPSPLPFSSVYFCKLAAPWALLDWGLPSTKSLNSCHFTFPVLWHSRIKCPQPPQCQHCGGFLTYFSPSLLWFADFNLAGIPGADWLPFWSFCAFFLLPLYWADLTMVVNSSILVTISSTCLEVESDFPWLTVTVSSGLKAAALLCNALPFTDLISAAYPAFNKSA